MHRVAYEYLAPEFTHRTGLSLETAPIFASLDAEAAHKTKGKGKPSRLLTIDVPESQVLRQDYKLWSNKMLFGDCLDHWPGTHGCPDPGCRDRSWAASFTVTEDTNQQIVLNRIEPEWVVLDEDLGEGQPGVASQHSPLLSTSGGTAGASLERIGPRTS
jgi:hypothetical protein